MNKNSTQAVPTAAEANDFIIRQLCEHLGCEHDVDSLIEAIEDLTSLREKIAAAEARAANTDALLSAGRILISAIRKAAGDPDGKLANPELVELINCQRRACATLVEGEVPPRAAPDLERHGVDGFGTGSVPATADIGHD